MTQPSARREIETADQRHPTLDEELDAIAAAFEPKANGRMAYVNGNGHANGYANGHHDPEKDLPVVIEPGDPVTAFVYPSGPGEDEEGPEAEAGSPIVDDDEPAQASLETLALTLEDTISGILDFMPEMTGDEIAFLKTLPAQDLTEILAGLKRMTNASSMEEVREAIAKDITDLIDSPLVRARVRVVEERAAEYYRLAQRVARALGNDTLITELADERFVEAAKTAIRHNSVLHKAILDMARTLKLAGPDETEISLERAMMTLRFAASHSHVTAKLVSTAEAGRQELLKRIAQLQDRLAIMDARVKTAEASLEQRIWEMVLLPSVKMPFIVTAATPVVDDLTKTSSMVVKMLAARNPFKDNAKPVRVGPDGRLPDHLTLAWLYWTPHMADALAFPSKGTAESSVDDILLSAAEIDFLPSADGLKIEGVPCSNIRIARIGAVILD